MKPDGNEELSMLIFAKLQRGVLLCRSKTMRKLSPFFLSFSVTHRTVGYSEMPQETSTRVEIAELNLVGR